MDRLKHSLDDVESPTCPHCGIGMQLYRSELVKFVPEINLHMFNCPTCFLFAESETVLVPHDEFAVPRFRFFAVAA
jgi:hypothetical protein